MKFFLETYGCQMNVSDSELVASILLEAGWEEASTLDEADVMLVNTCSIRQHAEDRVLGRITCETQRKRQKPDFKIAVLGCMGQRMGKRLLENGSGVDFVVGVDQYLDLPRLLGFNSGSTLELDQMQVYPGLRPRHGNKTNAFVTVMRGCDNFCSYCIVPYVRGRERSLKPEQIIQEVKLCGEEGRKDVTLLGQNVNSYQYKDQDFPALLKELNNLESIWRLRFITSHPKDLSDDLISAMADCEKVCHHIHLPLQSADNHILQAMNRKYTIEHYLELVTKLRKAMPDIAITTDLIAGFPGESEAMFANTVQALKEIRFDYAFCFKFSPRSGTAAADFADQLAEETRLRRLQQLIDLQRDITMARYTAQVGKQVEVYVENLSRKSSSQVSGKTRDYKICVMSGSAADIGTLKRGRVVKATSGTLICE